MTLKDRLDPYTMGDERAGRGETALVWALLFFGSWALVFLLILALWVTFA